MKSPFLSHIREYMLARRYAIRTIETYLYWIKYYIKFNHRTHPAKLNSEHVEAFLTFLIVDRNVAISTQTTALNALVFLYREIIKVPLSLNMNFTKSKRSPKLPTVLTPDEVKKTANFDACCPTITRKINVWQWFEINGGCAFKSARYKF